ncbi:MAG: outer membrane lipoprotein-sorting protein [Spirochaetales bacterium]|nr:outer membrane lipoprotein-sorting protein [Spirochaetales bacterium]
MKTTRGALLVLAALTALSMITEPAAAQSSTPTAEEILANTHLLGNAANIILTATMDIRSPRGDKSRTLEIYISQNDEASKILAQVTSPPFLRNLKFLTHQFSDGSDDKWVKTSRGVRRLAEGNYGEALFDSDFTVEDLSRIDESRFDLEVVDTGETSGVRAIKAIPTYNGPDYTHKIFKIEVDTGMLSGVDFFRDEALVKRYTLLERQVIGGEPYPLLCTMEDFAKGTSTVLEIDKVSIEDSIPERLFNRGSL